VTTSASALTAPACRIASTSRCNEPAGLPVPVDAESRPYPAAVTVADPRPPQRAGLRPKRSRSRMRARSPVHRPRRNRAPGGLGPPLGFPTGQCRESASGCRGGAESATHRADLGLLSGHGG
jgi:hypothetical protein